MLRSMHTDMVDASWLDKLYLDFQRRWMVLLGYEFRTFPVTLALELLKPPVMAEGGIIPQKLTDEELGFYFTPYDLKRLESYANNLVDYHMIIDLAPAMARIYFE